MLSRVLILTALLAILECGSSILVGQTYKSQIVAFYNLENLFDTIDTPGVRDTEFTPLGSNEWTGERYWDKISKIADVIRGIGEDIGTGAPAIMGLCELENKAVIEDVINDPKLKPYQYKIVHYDSPDKRGIDVCLIYQSKLFELVNSKSYPLLIYKEESGDRLYTRDQLMVSGLLDGEPMHFIVNHWPSRYGGEQRSRDMRNAAATLSRSIIDSIQAQDKKAKVILMGDLNDDPINESVLEHLNAVGDKSDIKKGNLYNPMHWIYKEGFGTLAYRDKWNLFDQIIVTPNFVKYKKAGYKLKSAHIYSDEKLLVPEGRYKGYPYRTYVGRTDYRGGYSDHLPVYIVLIKAI